MVVNRIDEAIVQDIPLPVQGMGQPVGLTLDDSSTTPYLYTSAPSESGIRRPSCGARQPCMAMVTRSHASSSSSTDAASLRTPGG